MGKVGLRANTEASACQRALKKGVAAGTELSWMSAPTDGDEVIPGQTGC